MAVGVLAQAVPAAAITQEEIVEDVRVAESGVDRFWERHWAEFFPGSYESPDVVGIYDGYDPASAPGCGGEPLGPGNASYCLPDDYVAYDASLLNLSDSLGDAFLFFVVAHEWGHAVQARLDPSLVAAQSELQADCLAGAALYGAAADGSFEFEDRDEEELAASLAAVADETPWTDTGDHGDAGQRTWAFELGRDRGVPGCLPS